MVALRYHPETTFKNRAFIVCLDFLITIADGPLFIELIYNFASHLLGIPETKIHKVNCQSRSSIQMRNRCASTTTKGKSAMKENVRKAIKMENEKQLETANCATPTKKVLTFHSYLSHNLASYQTPPSHSSEGYKVKNPFQQLLRENLGTSFISPSIFVKKSPVHNDFKWTIDELSILKPAEIDENQYASPEHDVNFESLTQSRIDSYFSMHEILPSPAVPCISEPLIKDEDDDCHDIRIETVTSSAQTVLTLPPVLPEEVEKVLAPYFNFTENQQGYDSNANDTLYKKLFDSPQVDENDDCDDHHELILSPVKHSPLTPKLLMSHHHHQRTIGTPGNAEIMKLCALSPICLDKKETKHTILNLVSNSTQIKSMNGFFNVPDVSVIDKHNSSQESISDTSYHSLGAYSSSAMNWDLEYKQLSSPKAYNLEEMEVSKSNTPKQRNILSQRKKLSDSFGNEMPSDNDDDDLMVISQQSAKGTDSGCGGSISHGCSDNTTETELWEGLHVVSSTPTKRNDFR